MNNCLWLIVLFNAILGWFVIAFVLRFIKNKVRQNEKSIKKIISTQVEAECGSGNPLVQEMESLDLASEIGSMLDFRLNQITQQVASQIPMGEFLLAGSLGQKMKLKIREEIFNMLPELKEHFVKRVSEEFDLKKLLQDKINQYDFNELLFHLEHHVAADFFKLKWLAALIGAAAGFIELSILFWLCMQ